uniref:Uncharacterized protein n=1 Tax=Romanomermis culicivorax TaxID=13658 RepID=A0A915K5S6_ROMCU
MPGLCMKTTMAQLTGNIAQLTAQQMAPAPRNPMPSMTPLAHVQNAGDHPSGAHLQMCSYHRRCTHKDASCQAQHLNSPCPSNAAATCAGRCYCFRMRAHPTD